MTNIQVKNIDHITLVVSDLDATTAFYVDLLGMEPVARPDFDFDGRWFQAGLTQVHATVQSEHAGSAGIRADAASPSRGHHFAFEVDDATIACEQLIANGIKIEHGPKRRPDGAVQLYIRDPDGHFVELYSK